MTQLFVLTNEYKSAEKALNDMDLDEQTISDTLAGMAGEITEKSTNVAMFIRNLESVAESIKAAESAMAERRKAIEKRAESIKYYLKSNMEAVGISKIECPHFVLSIKNNAGAVIIDDESKIPAEYLRTPEPPKPAPDKRAIKAAIESGVIVDGCRFEKSTRLEIK